MTPRGPRYVGELSRYIETVLDDPTALVAALAALLADPESYEVAKGQPATTLVDFVHELVLTNRDLQRHLADDQTPTHRALLDGRWSAVWRGARENSTATPSFDYDLCISFAGADRAVAEGIATALTSTPMQRRVFYDEFEKVNLWGEELFAYLHEVYSARSRFCLILFSHRYRERAWTRHELRAAQTRVLHERESYVLPVALDQGAVPDEFASVGFWSFCPGDEEKIAEAAEQKINDYIGQHYLPAEEIAELLTRSVVSGAILDGFRAGTKERRDAGDTAGAQALTALAVIAATDTERLHRPIRSLIDLVLFADGAVSALFDEEDNVVVFGRSPAKRWLGPQAPLLFSAEGWSGTLRQVEERLNALGEEDVREQEDAGGRA